MYFQRSTVEQETLPVSAMAFRRYLQRHQLEPLDVALASHVRYLAVWMIWQGLPIKQTVESLVRQGLFRITGVPYTAPMLVREERERTSRDSKTPLGRTTWM